MRAIKRVCRFAPRVHGASMVAPGGDVRAPSDAVTLLAVLVLMTEPAFDQDVPVPGGLEREPGRRRVVLLVEDDVDVSEAAAMLLEEEGYDVMRAREGAEALRWLERVRPDVIVLDLMMPRMPGWAFFDEKQKREELADIPMIAWTATPVADARIGDTRVVRKDEGPEALIEALRQAMSS